MITIYNKGKYILGKIRRVNIKTGKTKNIDISKAGVKEKLVHYIKQIEAINLLVSGLETFNNLIGLI